MPTRSLRKSTRRHRRTRKGTRAIAKRGLRIARTLASTREIKYFAGNYSTPQAVDTGVIIPLAAIAQGDTQTTRDGNMISLRSIRLMGYFESQPTAGGSFAMYRVILFTDKQQIADTPPAVGDVLAATQMTSPYNQQFQRRFKISYDKTFSINNYPAAPGAPPVITNQGQVKTWNKWFFPTMKRLYFNGAGPTDYQKNSPYLLIICENTAACPVLPVLEWQTSYNDS